MSISILQYCWAKFRLLPSVLFLLLAITLGIISLSSLRSNNEHMLKLRTAVYDADKRGTGVQESLQYLQLYVTQHMNTKLDSGGNAVYPPVQLKYTYDRLVQQQGAAIQQANAAQYAEAQANCATGGTSVQDGRNQLTCVINYMQDKHNLTVPTIPDALYKFDFISPAWSPDLAGWSIVATAASAFLFLVSFATRYFYKHFVS